MSIEKKMKANIINSCNNLAEEGQDFSSLDQDEFDKEFLRDNVSISKT